MSIGLKEKVGVELLDEKTKITHISHGFDFLGFNIRKYNPRSPYGRPKLVIKPAKENVTDYLRDIREIIKSALLGRSDCIRLILAERTSLMYLSPAIAYRRQPCSPIAS